jgi:nucleolar MIF4G domain-containing protein 1
MQSRKALRAEARKQKKQRRSVAQQSGSAPQAKVQHQQPNKREREQQSHDQAQQSKMKKMKKKKKPADFTPFEVGQEKTPDELEIEYLESKLGISGSSKDKNSKLLQKEWTKFDGYDDDFADFLNDPAAALARDAEQGYAGYDSDEQEEVGYNRPLVASESEASDSAAEEEEEEQEQAEEAWKQGGPLGADEAGLSDSSVEDSAWDPPAPAKAQRRVQRWQQEQQEQQEQQQQEEGSSSDDDDDDELAVDSDGEVLEGYSSAEEDLEAQERMRSGARGARDQEEEEEEEEEEEPAAATRKDHTYSASRGEDIYGRKVAAAPVAVPTKYVPPHLRAKLESAAEKAARELARSVNGLCNRMSEDTLSPTLAGLQELYRRNSRRDMNEHLFRCLETACFNPTQLVLSLVSLFGAAVAALHVGVGCEVGGFCVEQCVRVLQRHMHLALPAEEGGGSAVAAAGSGGGAASAQPSATKEASNALLLIAYLFNFGVVHCTLIYDIIRALLERFGEQDVELLLLLLRHTGFQLRGDDPGALRDIIVEVQERAKVEVEAKAKARAAGDAQASSSRIAFMLDFIYDLKNNRKRAAQEQEMERGKRLKKWLQAAKAQASASDQPLRVGLRDLLLSDKLGRWWLTGAAWGGRQASDAHAPLRPTSSSSAAAAENAILALAAKQRMNTDVRRSIFCVVMGAEDYVECAERLLALPLKRAQQREIIRVLVDCCAQEKRYNPYYALVAHNLCESNHSFKFTLQLCFWDFFKELAESPERRTSNLAQLLAHCLLSCSLSLVVFKNFNFTNLKPAATLFLRLCLTAMFVRAKTDEECRAVFQRLSQAHDADNIVQNGLAVFLQKNITLSVFSALGDEQRALAVRRCKQAKKALREIHAMSMA